MLLNGDCPESLKKEEAAAEPPRENGLDEADPGDETTGQEVIVIQDTGFSVKILAPGIEPFSLQVSPQEMVQEIHQVLMDREDTCHRTCFSL
ncbi:CLUH isoform 13, partial [Pan troglodytes]